MRASLPPIPDFTRPAFHKEHTDAQLLVSILDGKGTLMPANRGRITPDQARAVAAYVRAFGPIKPAAPPTIVSETDSDKAFKDLERQWNEYQKELLKLRGRK
jgi:hypothetical protein